jgi:hypothetical protein
MTTAHLARPLIPPQPTFAYFRFPPEVIVVKVAGRWRYVYRAIDQFGQVIDVLVSPRRDATAARRFFEQAIDTTKASPTRGGDRPAPTYPPVLEELLPAAWHRTDRYASTGLRLTTADPANGSAGSSGVISQSCPYLTLPARLPRGYSPEVSRIGRIRTGSGGGGHGDVAT